MTGREVACDGGRIRRQRHRPSYRRIHFGATPMTTDLTPLIARLEKCTGADREIDLAIALLCGFSLWKSKHGYWNVSWPDDWTFSEKRNVTVPGRAPDEVFDPTTGERLPPEEPPTGWADDIGCPEFTASLDAALSFAERVLPGQRLRLLLNAIIELNNSRHPVGNDLISALARFLLLAVLRALQVKGGG